MISVDLERCCFDSIWFIFYLVYVYIKCLIDDGDMIDYFFIDKRLINLIFGNLCG